MTHPSRETIRRRCRIVRLRFGGVCNSRDDRACGSEGYAIRTTAAPADQRAMKLALDSKQHFLESTKLADSKSAKVIMVPFEVNEGVPSHFEGKLRKR